LPLKVYSLLITLDFRHNNPQRLRLWPLSIHILRRNVRMFCNYPQRVVPNKAAKTRRIGPRRRSMFSSWVRSSHASSILHCNGGKILSSWENEILLDRGRNCSCRLLNYNGSSSYNNHLQRQYSHPIHLHRQYSLWDSRGLRAVACPKRGLRRV